MTEHRCYRVNYLLLLQIVSYKLPTPRLMWLNVKNGTQGRNFGVETYLDPYYIGVGFGYTV